MKAIVFAAGLGTRLGEFTKAHPKALVDVGGQTMLGRVLLKLKATGVSETVVNVHHFADQITDYLAANGNFGMDLYISHERELLLETGGGILAAAQWLDGNEPFICHNADILTDFPIGEMLEQHSTSGADATLLADARTTSRYLVFSADRRMEGWTNVTTGAIRPESLVLSADMQRLAFGGVHILSAAMIQELGIYNENLRSSGREADSRGYCAFSIMDFYIATCRINAYKAYTPAAPYRWCDVGKPESLAAARELFA